MRHVCRRPRGALTLAVALAATLSLPASAAAKTDPVVDLRVFGPAGALSDGASFVTGTERIRTSPRARCFTGGQGGSGAVVRVPGATAFGTLLSAADRFRALRPIRVTDEYGFGLGICAIGGIDADDSSYWAVKVNGRDLDVGADAARVRHGDRVTWAYTGFPAPSELRIGGAPPGVEPGAFTVKVTTEVCEAPPPDYVLTCERQPVAGAEVRGGDAPAMTNGAGEALVTAGSEGRVVLRAVKADLLPSPRLPVCVNARVARCPAAFGKLIIGRATADRFRATRGPDRIRARGGDDRINIRNGGADQVSCGGGRDVVLAKRGDRDDRIARNCERVVRR